MRRDGSILPNILEPNGKGRLTRPSGEDTMNSNSCYPMALTAPNSAVVGLRIVVDVLLQVCDFTRGIE